MFSFHFKLKYIVNDLVKLCVDQLRVPSKDTWVASSNPLLWKFSFDPTAPLVANMQSSQGNIQEHLQELLAGLGPHQNPVQSREILACGYFPLLL